MAESQRPPGRVKGGAIAVSMLLGVYVLVLLVGVGAIAIGIVAMVTLPTYAISKLLVVLGIIVFVMMAAVLRSMRLKPEPPRGIELTQAEQPRLWDTVRRLAAAVGTRPPDEIRLEAEVNASVSEDSRWLGLRGGKRTMHIGAPLLLGMSAGQLYSVLGHELGHYSAATPVRSNVSWRGLLALQKIILNMDYAVVRKLFTWYFEIYFRVTQGIRRAQEHEADRVGIAVTGRQQALSALQHAHRIAPAWELAVEAYGPLAKAAGRSPDLFAAYWALLNEPGRAALYDSALEAALAEPTGRYDNHPALRDRLAAAAAQPEPGVPMDNTPASSVIAYLPQVLGRLQEQLLRSDLGPPASWPELVALAAKKEAADVAGELVRVAAPGQPALTLGQVLDGVASGHGASMVRPLVNPGVAPEDRPVAFRAVCTQMVSGCVTTMMMEAGLAWARVDWAGPHPWQLVGPDGAVVDVDALVAAAVAGAMPDTGQGGPQGVALLREQLVGMRVPLDRPIRPVEHDPLAPGLVALLLNVKLDKMRADLLVCDTGLLFVKQKWWRRANGGQLAIAQRNVNKRRLKHVLKHPLPELCAAPENRFIGTHDIVAARFAGKKGATRLELSLTDGSAVVLASTGESVDMDDAVQQVYRLLGARLQNA